MSRPESSTSDNFPSGAHHADHIAYAEDGLVPVSFMLPSAFLERFVDKAHLLSDRSDPCRALAYSLLQNRRRRSSFLGSNVTDPVLNMMLELYVARAEGRAVDVMSLCRASGLAETTAQGYVHAWTETGGFVKLASPDDGRRMIMSLSPELLSKLERYLSRCIDLLAIGGFVFKGSA